MELGACNFAYYCFVYSISCISLYISVHSSVYYAVNFYILFSYNYLCIFNTLQCQYITVYPSVYPCVLFQYISVYS